MKALLAYSFAEALGSLRRGWRATLLALLTTTAAVFVAAAAVLVSINLQEIFAKLGTASELTVYLRGTPSQAERDRLDALLARAPGVQSRRFITPQEALRRFAADVPELAPLTNALGENPFPPAFEVRLRPSETAAEGDRVARQLIESLEATGLVEDVRYDRQVIDRLLAGMTTAQNAAAMLAGILVLAAVLTITSVLRLAYQTRQEEISILYLVGAPPRAIRGPFVAEGFLQALAGRRARADRARVDVLDVPRALRSGRDRCVRARGRAVPALDLDAAAPRGERGAGRAGGPRRGLARALRRG